MMVAFLNKDKGHERKRINVSILYMFADFGNLLHSKKEKERY